MHIYIYILMCVHILMYICLYVCASRHSSAHENFVTISIVTSLLAVMVIMT